MPTIEPTPVAGTPVVPTSPALTPEIITVTATITVPEIITVTEIIAVPQTVTTTVLVTEPVTTTVYDCPTEGKAGLAAPGAACCEGQQLDLRPVVLAVIAGALIIALAIVLAALILR